MISPGPLVKAEHFYKHAKNESIAPFYLRHPVAPTPLGIPYTHTEAYTCSQTIVNQASVVLQLLKK